MVFPAQKKKGPSGFSWSSTAEEVTHGVDGRGLVAIVTGASSGLGAETTTILALRGVHVYMGVRKVETGESVKQDILRAIPSAKVEVMELDLASTESVRNFASQFNSLDQPLNILINNAGVMACPYLLSKDGTEMQFATNHVGHFLLTNLLLDKMKASATESNIEGRIVNVSSGLHTSTYKEGIHFDKINDKSEYNPWKAYGQSKLANILHANELTRCFQEGGVPITANSLHPGVIATNLSRHMGVGKALMNTVGKFFLKSIPQGAATTCYVALHPQVRGVSGKYFADCNETSPSSFATNAELAKKLWDFTVDLLQ